MKTILYYFTGTGNSLSLARDLANALEGETKLCPMASFVNKEHVLAEADIIGLIYPAWLHHIPPMVEEFVAKSEIICNYLFAVCSYSASPYNSVFNLNALLTQKNKHLDAGFAVAMGGKYNLLTDLVFSDKENQRRIEEAKHRINHISDIVNSQKQAGIEGQFEESDSDYSKQLIHVHKNVYKVQDKFYVNSDCDLCGLCIKVCPRNNLGIANNKLVWGDNCDYCLACLHWCPKSSVQNGEITLKSGRYHHKNITADDIAKQKDETHSQV